MNKVYTKTDHINIFLKIALSGFGAAMFLLFLIDPATHPKPLSYIAEMILPFAPEILARFGIRTSKRLQIAYSLFLVPAMAFGICLDWYKTLYIFGQPAFDKVSHSLSGVLAAFVAKEALDNCYYPASDKKYSSRFAFLFITSFVALSAAGWECFEFLYDTFTGGTMQELIAPGVADTMWDIMSAMMTGMVAAFPLADKKFALQRKA